MEVAIGSLSSIPPGEGRNFDVGELRIAVFHMRDGSVYATQPDCPHRGGPLADGLTDSGNVVCPLHDRVFDLKTGQEFGADCKLKVYPARIDPDSTILVRTE